MAPSIETPLLTGRYTSDTPFPWQPIGVDYISPKASDSGAVPAFSLREKNLLLMNLKSLLFSDLDINNSYY